MTLVLAQHVDKVMVVHAIRVACSKFSNEFSLFQRRQLVSLPCRYRPCDHAQGVIRFVDRAAAFVGQALVYR